MGESAREMVRYIIRNAYMYPVTTYVTEGNGMENRYKTSKTGKQVLKEYTRKPNTRWYELVMSCEVTPHVGAAHNIPWTHPIKRYQDQIRHGIYKTRYNLETDEWELWHNHYGV